MTSIKLTVSGAQVWATVNGTLTSGMVGIPVTIKYDKVWDGLIKNLVCRCGQREFGIGEQRAILNVGSTATVAHEVMKPNRYLYLGIEGYSPDGKLVIPTTWAECGMIQSGANTGADLSADPTLPVWNQLQTEIEQLKEKTFPEEQIIEIQSYVRSAVQAADRAVGAVEEADKAARAAAVSADKAEASAVRAENAAGTSQNTSLTAAQVEALDGMFRLVKYESETTGAYAAFCAAFGITAKTLESITAVYSGGEVAVGTALTDLVGITVTAVYSDGSTRTVTGYTLSGGIAEGENTITVAYGGKTATITVVGVASGDGGDEPAEPLYGRFWPPINRTDWTNLVWDGVDNFAYADYASEYVDAGFPAGSFVRLDKLQGTVYIRTLSNNQYGSLDIGYNVYANTDGEIATGGFTNVTPIVNRNLSTMDVGGVTYYFVLFEFRIPAGETGYFVSKGGCMASGMLLSNEDQTAILDEYKPYYTLFDSDPSERITEPATEVA